MGLSLDQIHAVLNATGKSAKADKTKGFYFTVSPDGAKLDLNYGKPKADEVGRFEGKVGTMKRSRRGVATRMPNGSRKFQPGKLSDSLESVIVAYKV